MDKRRVLPSLCNSMHLFIHKIRSRIMRSAESNTFHDTLTSCVLLPNCGCIISLSQGRQSKSQGRPKEAEIRLFLAFSLSFPLHFLVTQWLHLNTKIAGTIICYCFFVLFFVFLGGGGCAILTKDLKLLVEWKAADKLTPSTATAVRLRPHVNCLTPLQ